MSNTPGQESGALPAAQFDALKDRAYVEAEKYRLACADLDDLRAERDALVKEREELRGLLAPGALAKVFNDAYDVAEKIPAGERKRKKIDLATVGWDAIRARINDALDHIPILPKVVKGALDMKHPEKAS